MSAGDWIGVGFCAVAAVALFCAVKWRVGQPCGGWLGLDEED